MLLSRRISIRYVTSPMATPRRSAGACHRRLVAEPKVDEASDNTCEGKPIVKTFTSELDHSRGPDIGATFTSYSTPPRTAVKAIVVALGSMMSLLRHIELPTRRQKTVNLLTGSGGASNG